MRRVFLFLMFCVSFAPVCAHAAQQALVEHFVGDQGGVGTRDGRGSDARFNAPRGVWFDGTYAYVVDQNNYTIRKIAVATGDVTTIAGVPQQPQAGTIQYPSLVWGNGSSLYFVDQRAIRRLEMTTGQITTFAGPFRGAYGITGNSSHLYILEPPPLSLSSSSPYPIGPAAIRRISLDSGEMQTLPLPQDIPNGLSNAFDPSSLWADEDFLYLSYLSRAGSLTLGRMNLNDLQFAPVMGFPLPASDPSRYIPRNLWSDGVGNFFFTDNTNIYRVRLSTGEFSLIASAPPATRKYTPAGIAGLSGFGETLVATDSLAHVVFKVNAATSEVSTVAGLASIAPSPYEEVHPLGGATGVWRQGNFVYVADTDRSLIYKIAADTGEMMTFVRSLHAPYGISGDEKTLYVTQPFDKRIAKVSLATGEVEQTFDLNSSRGNPYYITADSTYLYVGFLGVPAFVARISKVDGVITPWEVSDVGLSGIKGTWTDGRILYVLDTWKLYKVDLSTNDIVTVAGLRGTLADTGTRPALAAIPSALWSDGHFVYVAETGAIQQFDPATGVLTTLAGVPVYGGRQDGIGENARLSSPKGMSSDGQYLYFTDDSLRRLKLATREVTTWIGRVLLLSEGRIPPQQFATTNVIGDGQYLYAVSGHAIYRVSLATREITPLAGAFNESGFKDGIGSEARFDGPTTVFKVGRHLFVVDQVNVYQRSVRRVDVNTGEVITFLKVVDLRTAWGDTNVLYVADSSTIYRMDMITREMRPLVSGLQFINHIWGDGTNLYVTAGNCTVRKIDLRTAESSLLAGNAAECKFPLISTPQPIVDGTGTEARFAFPNAIWGDGRLLYINDGFTLRTVHPLTGETHTIAGDWRIYGSENGGSEAHFTGAASTIWGDGTYLYVADGAIRRITVMGTATASVNFDVRSGGADYWRSSPTSESLKIGYARVQPAAGSAPPDGMVTFGFRSQGVLVSEASVPASPLIQSGRIYAETDNGVRTGIAIANPNDSSATISFYFTDASGATFGNGVITIAAKQQIASFLNEAPFNGTAAARSFTFTSSVPVGAIALRGYLNERSDFLMTTLPVAPIASTLSSTVVLPHFASGGGWTTQILLLNPTDDPMSGTMQLDSTYTYFIAPRSAAKVVSTNTGADIRSGLVRIIPASGTRTPVASTVFSLVSGGIMVTESGVATTGTAQSFRVFAEFDSATTLRTGIAVANLSSAAATVQFELLTLDGQATGFSGSSAVSGNGQFARFLDELPGFKNLPASFRGVLRISANAPLSVIGLRERYNERGDFLISATPAISDDAPAASGELIFPHIVTGGGYTTEFVLLSRGNTSAGTVAIRSQSGAELAIPTVK